MKKLFAVLAAVCVLTSQAVMFAHAADTPRINKGMFGADGGIYTSHANKKNKIALTFDDGPHPVYTPQILEILDEYGIPATFFMIGENVKNYPATAAKVIDAGHEIGNHTMTHGFLTKKSTADIKREILGCERSIYETADCRPKLLRPPGGKYKSSLCDIAGALDYDIVLWTVDTHDWAHKPPKDICAKVTAVVKSGDIILMHDFIGRNSPTPAALKLMIPELKKRGFEFVRVSELIGEK